jgi:hypothetical protein
MKLMGTCDQCHRDFLLEQLIQPVASARCPWCGSGLARHYTMLLPRLIRETERAGKQLTSALSLLNGDWFGFELNGRSVLGQVEDALRSDNEATRGGVHESPLRSTDTSLSRLAA